MNRRAVFQIERPTSPRRTVPSGLSPSTAAGVNYHVPARKAPDDVALAWELAVAAHPRLRRFEADRIYIAIGVGDAFDAIDALINAIARDRIEIDFFLLNRNSTE